VPVAAAQEIIDPDAGDSVEIDARGLQIQAVDIRTRPVPTRMASTATVML